MAGKINKVIFGGEVIIDLSADTAEASTVLDGQTFHDKSGETVTGTCPFDSDTSKDTAGVAEILKGKTAHARGALLTGTMPNNGAVKLELQGKSKPVKIPQGYHDGSGEVAMNAADAAKLIPQNIRQGVEILDVVGSMTGTEGMRLQSKTVTPDIGEQIVLPDASYNGLSQVKVLAIPYRETANAAGGLTAVIGKDQGGGGGAN